MSYGSGKDANRMAEIFRMDMPIDPLMGVLAEAVRKHPRSERSSHPILSFVGINAVKFLEAQALKEPLAPIQALRDAGGWVLLLGVGHTANTSIHYGEQLAGRKQFIRWALTPKGVIPCHKFPGCSAGFGAISSHLGAMVRQVTVGNAEIQAIPILSLLESVCTLLQDDPLALLCSQTDCARCNAVRASLRDPQSL
jgi:aminoglycoside 3-N-acetyltransferase